MPVMTESTSATPQRSATDLVESLRAAVPRGVHDSYETLIDHFADVVEFRHQPPVPALDGLRSRAESAAYLRSELIAFPRAFHDDLMVTLVRPLTDGAWVRVPEIHWRGTLVTTERFVDIGMGLALLVDRGQIAVIEGTVLASTLRDDLVGWLKAVAATGGFEHSAARRPPGGDSSPRSDEA
jgi:hypothetical protein